MLTFIILFIVLLSMIIYSFVSFIFPQQVNNLTLDSTLNVTDGYYKIDFPKQDNYLDFTYGILKVENSKIIAIEGVKKYDEFWSYGFYSCENDLNIIHKTYLNNDSMLKTGLDNKFISDELIEKRILGDGYNVHIKCYIKDNQILMKFSLSVFELNDFISDLNIKFDELKSDKLYDTISEDNLTVTNDYSYNLKKENFNEIKKYGIFNYHLGTIVKNKNYINDNNIVLGNKLFYEVDNYFYENDDFDPNLPYNTTMTANQNNQISKMFTIKPSKIYVTVDNIGLINGIYSLTNYSRGSDYIIDGLSICKKSMNIFIDKFMIEKNLHNIVTLTPDRNNYSDKDNWNTQKFEAIDKKNKVKFNIICENHFFPKMYMTLEQY